MKNIEDINKAAVTKILLTKKITNFSPGDTIKVGVRIVEGKKERIQYFEGVCIAKKNRDINSSFTVRKISFGEGVERTFALYSPVVDSIKVIRSGKVRRAKLYYLRDRTGKSARIAEKIKKKIGVDLSTNPVEPKIEEAPKAEVKLVRCIKGSIWDVVVDLRSDSKTFGKWFGATLSEENRTMMYAPKGFAHGFISLEPNTEILYSASDFYEPVFERALIWNDNDIKIDWPIDPIVISDKDNAADTLKKTTPIKL